MEKNYYEILGITEEEKKLHGEEFNKIVNKKYKAIALKNHPDRLVGKPEAEVKAAEEIFKQANEAKDVLTDENKRLQYDNPNAGNPFGDFGGFGGFNPFGDFFRGGHRNSGPMPERGDDIEIHIKVSLKEAFSGVNKEVTYNRKKPCSSCNGTGSEDGKITTCPHCGGSGMFTQTTRRGNAIFQQSSVCPHCHGSGKINEHPCKKCNGTGFENEIVTEKFDIPSGVINGMAFNIPNRGNPGKNGGPSGNLFIHISVDSDNKYSREGDNLVYTEKISISDALLGCEKEITHINGEVMKIKIHEATKDSEEIKVSNKGFGKLNQWGQISGHGDFIIRIKYDYPTKLTNEQKKLIENLKELGF